MGVWLDVIEDALASQAVIDRLIHVEDAHPGEPVETFYEFPFVVERGDDVQPELGA